MTSKERVWHKKLEGGYCDVQYSLSGLIRLLSIKAKPYPWYRQRLEQLWQILETGESRVRNATNEGCLLKKHEGCSLSHLAFWGGQLRGLLYLQVSLVQARSDVCEVEGARSCFCSGKLGSGVPSGLKDHRM